MGFGARSFNPGDVLPPTVPVVTATRTGPQEITVTWGASSDASGVARYYIREYGVPGSEVEVIGPNRSRSYSGLTPNTAYRYEVRAQDIYGNISLYGTSPLVSTLPINVAPVWSVIPPLELAYNTGGTRDVKPYVADANGDPITISLVNPPAGYTIANGVINATASVAAATLTLSASDGLLTAQTTMTVTVQAGGVIYETYANPFTADSIWNLPIQPTAQFTHMNFNPNDLVWTGDAPLPCNRFSASDPLVTVYRKINYLGTVGDVSNIDFNTIKCVMRIPNSYVADAQITDGGKFAFVMPDAAGAYYSGGSAIPYAAGDVQEMYAFERVAGRNYAAASFMSVLPHSIRGNGRPLNGQQGGSGMSTYGGLIRSGELTSPVGVDIPHALKFDMWSGWLYYNAAFTETSIEGRGWIWPADRDDSFASTNYSSSNPLAKMGRLYALHPSFNTNSMQLEITRKIARALQVYGGYPVDATGPTGTNTKLFYTEAVNYSIKTVRSEVLAAYGINMNYLLMTGAGLSGNSLRFLQDIKIIMANLHSVTNVTPSTPKG